MSGEEWNLIQSMEAFHATSFRLTRNLRHTTARVLQHHTQPEVLMRLETVVPSHPNIASSKHISFARMKDVVNAQKFLNPAEFEHLSGCGACLELTRLAV